MKLWIAIVVLMFATVGHAGGGYFTGDQLLGWCESESGEEQNACNAYLAGVVDTDSAYYSRSYMTSKGFCIPKSAMLRQLRKVAIKGLNEKPEQLHAGAAEQVFLIFRKAFPC